MQAYHVLRAESPMLPPPRWFGNMNLPIPPQPPVLPFGGETRSDGPSRMVSDMAVATAVRIGERLTVGRRSNAGARWVIGQ